MITFTLKTSSEFYSDEGKALLEPLGFTFTKTDSAYFIKIGQPWERWGEPTITVNTLDELMGLARRVNQKIILNVDEMTLEIYDDYRE